MANLAVAVTVRDAGGLVGSGSAVITTTDNAGQLPALFAPYPARPAWSVAGVDYAVGVPAGTVLRDVRTVPLPAGVSRATGGLTVTGHNVVLDAIDFSVDGGWGVNVTTGNNATIRRCKFLIGTRNINPINALGKWNSPTYGSGVILEDCEIDGANRNTGLATLVAIGRGGTNVIRRNLIKNADTDWIHLGAEAIAGGLPTTYYIRDNLWIQAAQTSDPNAHSDWFQTFAQGRYNQIDIIGNTFVQTSSPQGTQGIILQGNGNTPLATFGGGLVHRNIAIMKLAEGRMNFCFAVAKDITTGTWTFNDNWVDATALHPTRRDSDMIRKDTAGGTSNGTIIRSGNVDLMTGSLRAGWND